MEPNVEKKRRGRKAKNAITEEIQDPTIEKIPKKRGRKPKGGKVVICQPSNENSSDQTINVVLHLKCNKEDIETSNNKNETNSTV